jgi:hypothetical protein
MFFLAVCSFVGSTNQNVVKKTPFDGLYDQVVDLAKHDDAVNHKEFFAAWLRLLSVERESGEFTTALEVFKTQLGLVSKSDTTLAIAFMQLKW